MIFKFMNYLRTRGRCVSGCYVAFTASLQVRGHIDVPDSFRVRSGAKLKIKSGGSLVAGQNCELKEYSFITCKASVKLGCNTALGAFCFLDGVGPITFGNDVRVGPGCVFVSSSHNHSNPGVPISQQGLSGHGIEVGNDVWIGANCSIIDGAKIGDGVVIGAGSVVRGALESGGVYAGAPAKKIRTRRI